MSFVSPLFTEIRNTQRNITLKWPNRLDTLHINSVMLKDFLVVLKEDKINSQSEMGKQNG